MFLCFYTHNINEEKGGQYVYAKNLQLYSNQWPHEQR